MRHPFWLVACAIVGAFADVAPRAAVSAPQPAAPETVFFAVDDHSIPWRHNLKLTLVQATKHPANPVLRSGPKGSPDSP